MDEGNGEPWWFVLRRARRNRMFARACSTPSFPSIKSSLRKSKQTVDRGGRNRYTPSAIRILAPLPCADPVNHNLLQSGTLLSFTRRLCPGRMRCHFGLFGPGSREPSGCIPGSRPVSTMSKRTNNVYATIKDLFVLNLTERRNTYSWLLHPNVNKS